MIVQFRVYGSLTVRCWSPKVVGSFFFLIFPPPRRLRRPNHPNLFLLGFSSKLILWLPPYFQTCSCSKSKARVGGTRQCAGCRSARCSCLTLIRNQVKSSCCITHVSILFCKLFSFFRRYQRAWTVRRMSVHDHRNIAKIDQYITREPSWYPCSDCVLLLR